MMTASQRRPTGLTGELLGKTLGYARERDYTGWDYGDGMSSRLLQALPVDNKWVNIAIQETIKRAPVNVRPLFLVEQRRNYKGTAMFTMANLAAHELDLDESSGVDYGREAHDLAEWLVEERTPGYAGFCGAHRHEIQHLDIKGLPSYPDMVSTAYAVRALLAAHDAGLDTGTVDYAETVRSVADFIDEDLEYEEIDDGARMKYVPTWSSEHYTLNAVALGGVTLLELGARFGGEHRERGEKLLDYVVSCQRPEGGWMYRDPPSASHLSMDNHHNGFIIESLLRHRELTGADRYAGVLDDALAFYREELFADDGAPNWDESNSYPRDINAAAQGIIVFSRAGEFAAAERIIDWVLGTLYAGDGKFRFRRERFFTRRVTLMRWCEAAMAYALATYLDQRASSA
ncbi:antibiotic ABC transporter permease [Halococcus dombrowskii]|nr:antibiotic ABC transporter permease [Halococcus dombrowskii]UOO94459.1 antibiotic ABC transporter permease [Halococcus dombrowskii]